MTRAVSGDLGMASGPGDGPQRDRDIVFRAARGETYVSISSAVNLSQQRVGQIDRESLRKINARLRADPQYRRLYEPEGGTPND